MCFVKRGTYEGGVSLIKSARACREIERGGDGRRLVCCAPRSRARRALARAQFVDSLYLSGPSSASVHSREHARAGLREQGRQGERIILFFIKSSGPQPAMPPHPCRQLRERRKVDCGSARVIAAALVRRC